MIRWAKTHFKNKDKDLPDTNKNLEEFTQHWNIREALKEIIPHRNMGQLMEHARSGKVTIF
jgi:hypothetical protein